MNIQMQKANIDIKITKILTKLFSFLFPIKLNNGKEKIVNNKINKIFIIPKSKTCIFSGLENLGSQFSDEYIKKR